MKKVEILSVGTELLMGQIANTNAQYLSRKLPEIGLGVYYHSVVGDNPKRLKNALKIAQERADVIILTGGLGPTQDDLTKETVSEFLGLTQKLDEPSLQIIKDFFKRIGKPMTESNVSQAMFPVGSTILKNDFGTAPGCAIKTPNGRIFIMLPGPPRELIPMYDNYVAPYLQEKDVDIKSIFANLVGIPESLVEKTMIDMIDGQTNPTYATYAKDGVLTIRVTASGENASQLLEKAAKQLDSLFGDAIYSYSGETPEEALVKALKTRNIHVSTVESLTGGLISEKITSVPGASQITCGGIVSYANEVKNKLVGVNSETLSKFGAVSEETAREMVIGGSKIFGSELTISVTGNAGPDAMDGKPVGRVYCGIKYYDKIIIKEFNFTGNRERIRTLTACHAMFEAVRTVRGSEK